MHTNGRKSNKKKAKDAAAAKALPEYEDDLDEDESVCEDTVAPVEGELETGDVNIGDGQTLAPKQTGRRSARGLDKAKREGNNGSRTPSFR